VARRAGGWPDHIDTPVENTRSACPFHATAGLTSPPAVLHPDPMPDLALFLSLETRVWQALADGDAAADGALLAPDFLGVYATGFAGPAEHVAQLSGGPTVAAFALSDARLLPLGPDRALLAYRADYSRAGADRPEAMYVSSIWEARGDGWRNVFSQDTAEGDVAPV